VQPHTRFNRDFIDPFKPLFQAVRRPKKGSLFAGNHRASVDKSSSLQEKKHAERRHRKKARQSSLLNHSTPQTQMKINITPSLRSTLFVACASIAIPLQAQAQIASDNASNAAYSGAVWTDGSNGGTGFGGWGITNTPGFGGSAGTFIGNPSSAGISGMSATSFGFYANPLGSGANAEASRGMNTALQNGQTFSFQWGLNWDSDSATSFRGFKLKAVGSELININMSNSAVLKINGSDMFTQMGSAAFTLNFEQVSDTSLRVYGTGRDGSETYDNTFTVGGRADNFGFYFNATSVPDAPDTDNRQMYVNNLSIVPEPSTWVLIGIGSAFLLWRIRRKDYAGS
jgi:PEP-CTERM motif